MWACPHCEKTFAHHSSRRRHVLAAHKKNNMSNIFDSDSQSSADEDPANDGGIESAEKDCDDAWKKIILEVFDQLEEKHRQLSKEELIKEEYIFDVTIPAVMRFVEAKLTEAECLRQSELYTALDEEKEKLMDGGMDEWEAKLMARSNRRYLVVRQIVKALNSQDEEEDNENE